MQVSTRERPSGLEVSLVLGRGMGLGVDWEAVKTLVRQDSNGGESHKRELSTHETAFLLPPAQSVGLREERELLSSR